MGCSDTVWVRSPSEQPPFETNSTSQLPVGLHYVSHCHCTLCHTATFSSWISLFWFFSCTFFCISSSQNLGQCRMERWEWKSRVKQPFFLPILSRHPSCSCCCCLVPKVLFLRPQDHHMSLSLTSSFPSPSHLVLLPPRWFLGFLSLPMRCGLLEHP